MKESKLNFKNIGIYGDEGKEVSPYFLFIESLQWNKKKHKGYIKPHLHSSLFQINVIKGGGVFFKADSIQKLITEPTIILIPEDHIHSLKFEQPTEGWTLSFSLNILEELMEKTPAGFSNFNEVRLIENFNNHPTHNIILDLCEQINEEQNDGGVYQSIFNISSIGLILYYINRLGQQIGTDTRNKKESKEFLHLRKFKKLIKGKIDASKKVSEYASELNITSTHLNRICNSLTGISASQTIYNNIISESKKYLIHSTFTISEIAYILNFKSPSHYSKFFRNQTDYSPKGYRERKVSEAR